MRSPLLLLLLCASSSMVRLSSGQQEWAPISGEPNGSSRHSASQPSGQPHQEMQFPLYMRILATIACLVILAVGVCGNLLVPLVVIKTKYLRNSTNLFLINLSVADLLVLIVCMPTVLIELHSRPETWLLGEPMCKLSNFVEMLAANGSIFTILAISFERYYAICKPLKAGYKCTRLRATLIICLVWLLASVLTSPILIIAKSNETIYIDGSLVYNCILETDTYWPKMYAFVSLVAFFCLPLLVLMLVYWLIGRRLTRESLAMGTTTSLAAGPELAAAAAAATTSTSSSSGTCSKPSRPAKVAAEGTGSGPKRAASLKFKSILAGLRAPNCAHYQSLREARASQSIKGAALANLISSGSPGKAASNGQVEPGAASSPRPTATSSELGSSGALKLGTDVQADGNDKTAITYSSIKGPSGLLARLTDRLLAIIRQRRFNEFKASSSGAGGQAQNLALAPHPSPESARHHQSGQSEAFPGAGVGGENDAPATLPSAKTNDCHCSPRPTTTTAATRKPNSQSRRSKFSLAKRFSVSSSSASMQTNCTTLLSDGSSIGGGGRSHHKSPRLLQRSSLESDGAHDCGFSLAKGAAGAKRSNAVGPLISAPTYYASSVSGNSSSTPYTSKSPSPDSMFAAATAAAAESPGERRINEPNPVGALLNLNLEPSNGGGGGEFDRCGQQRANSLRAIANEIDEIDDGEDDNSETEAHLIDAANQSTSSARRATRNCDCMDLEQGCRSTQKALNGSKPTTCSLSLKQQRMKHQEQLANKSNATKLNSLGTCHPTTSELLVVQDQSKKQQMDSRRQVVMMLAFVVACFFLLFFPYRVFTIWLILSTEDQVQSLGMETYYNLTYFSRILIYLHSAINPIAYNLISTKFRKAFMSILLCRGPSSRRHFTTEHHRMVYNNNNNNNSNQRARLNSQQLQRNNNKSTTIRQAS